MRRTARRAGNRVVEHSDSSSDEEDLGRKGGRSRQSPAGNQAGLGFSSETLEENRARAEVNAAPS